MVEPKPNEMLCFTAPEQHFPSIKGNLIVVPYQNEAHVTDEVRFMRQLRVTGWDWRPEALKEHRGSHTVFCGSSSMYPEDVQSELTKAGFKVIQMIVGATVFKELMTFKGSSSVAPKPLVVDSTEWHGRTRYLYKHNVAKFSAWELEFVKSIGLQLGQGKKVSPKQIMQLERLFTKYKVPQDATARNYGDDNLTTLRNIVPSIQQFTEMDTEEGRHYQAARNVNTDGQARKKYPEELKADKKEAPAPNGKVKTKKKTISELRKDKKLKEAKIEKDKKKLKIELAKQKTEREAAEANDLPSAFAIGDAVYLVLQDVKLTSRVLAVTFMTGKVLYHLAVYTGFKPIPEAQGMYGMINTIGWDEQGREYIRLDRVESSLIEPILPLAVIHNHESKT